MVYRITLRDQSCALLPRCILHSKRLDCVQETGLSLLVVGAASVSKEFNLHPQWDFALSSLTRVKRRGSWLLSMAQKPFIASKRARILLLISYPHVEALEPMECLSQLAQPI